jgi:hypothetical protein
MLSVNYFCTWLHLDKARMMLWPAFLGDGTDPVVSMQPVAQDHHLHSGAESMNKDNDMAKKIQ